MTDKITLQNVSSIDNTLLTAINNNNAAITAAINNTLSRDGTAPNQMSASLDMNSQAILNVPFASQNTEPVVMGQLANVGSVPVGYPTMTGDVTGTINTSTGQVPTTLATVNSNVGTFTYPSITVNGKGLVTAASNAAISSATTFWFSGSGSDVTGNGSNGNPFQTLQHCFNVVSSLVVLNNATITFKSTSAQTYSNGLNILAQSCIGSAEFIVDGNGSTFNDTGLGTNIALFNIEFFAPNSFVTFQNMTISITGSGNLSFSLSAFTNIGLNSLTISQTNVTNNVARLFDYSFLQILGNITLTGALSNNIDVFQVNDYAILQLNSGVTITGTTSPIGTASFSFYFVHGHGVVKDSGITYSGFTNFVGTKYFVSELGLISSNGNSVHIPGAAGSTANGGVVT